MLEEQENVVPDFKWVRCINGMFVSVSLPDFLKSESASSPGNMTLSL